MEPYQVLETQPSTAIDINNVDIEVEFHRTLTEKEQMEQIERIKRERAEAEKGPVNSGDAHSEGRRLDEEQDADLLDNTVLCKNWYLPSIGRNFHSMPYLLLLPVNDEYPVLPMLCIRLSVSVTMFAA